MVLLLAFWRFGIKLSVSAIRVVVFMKILPYPYLELARILVKFAKLRKKGDLFETRTY